MFYKFCTRILFKIWSHIFYNIIFNCFRFRFGHPKLTFLISNYTYNHNKASLESNKLLIKVQFLENENLTQWEKIMIGTIQTKNNLKINQKSKSLLYQIFIKQKNW